MNGRVLVALLVAMAFAGCTSVAPAEEHLTISINDVGDVPYVIGVPLWLAPGGPNATQWRDHAQIHLGQVTEFHLNETERGTALWIAGNGTVTVGFSDVQTWTGDAFTHGAFSLGVGADGVRPVFFVQEGDVDLTWFYEGQSERCYLPVTASWNSPGTGWHVAHAFSRQDPSFDCQ